jgi:hypothetical protein
MITLRKQGGEEVLRCSLLDQSDEGVAIQLGLRCQIVANEQVELLVGDIWEPAIVTSIKRQGIAHRIGLRWVATSDVAGSQHE